MSKLWKPTRRRLLTAGGGLAVSLGTARASWLPLAAPATGGVGTLSIDGTATGGGGTGSFTITLSTTKTNDVIILSLVNNSTTVSTVTSANVSNWTFRGQSSGSHIEEWWGTASSILTNEVITVTPVSGGSFSSGIAMAVNGCDISSPPTSIYDINGGLPFTGTASPISGISTTKNATLIFGCQRNAGDDGATSGGYTSIGRGIGLFQTIDYQIFASPQSGITIPDTATGINGWVADALRASGQ